MVVKIDFFGFFLFLVKKVIRPGPVEVTDHCLHRAQLFETNVRNSCSKQLFETVVRNSCSKQLFETVVRNSCSKQLFETVVRNSGSKQWFETFVRVRTNFMPEQTLR
jgi:hypothetical protein